MLYEGLLLAGYFLAGSSAFPFPGQKRALYISDNDPAGNNIISAAISNDNGLLLNPVQRFPTGGKGFFGTLSQDGVVVEDEYLFVPNGGDNTLSVFKIDPLNPTQLRLLGKPVATNGHTPQTVTYSSALNMACTVNAGDVAGVKCYNVDPFHGLTPLPFFLEIPQTENDDPSPPVPGPLSIVGDIRFNPSSTHLFAAVRSNGGRPGLLYAWPVSQFGRSISSTPANSTLPDLPFAFSLNFLSSDSKLFMTTPHGNSPGAAILDIGSTGAVENVSIVDIPGQQAVCWAAYDSARSKIYVADSSIPTISIVDTMSGQLLSQFNYSTPALGSLDNKVDGNYLYQLTGPFDPIAGKVIAPPQVLVYDVSGRGTPKQLQSFNIFGATNGTWPGEQGLAIYPAARFT